MASTGERLHALVSNNIEIDGKPADIPADLNVSLADLGVSSLDRVALAKLVAAEFSITFSLEDCTNIENLSQLVEFIDANTS